MEQGKAKLTTLKFREQVTHPLFLLAVEMASVFFFVNGFLADVGSIIDEKAGRDQGKADGEAMKRAFNLICSGASLLTPVVGVLPNRLSFQTSAYLQILLGCGYIVAAKLLPLSQQPVGFIIWGLLSIMYAFVYSYVGNRFGHRHYGKLSGVCMLTMALANLINIAVQASMSSGKSRRWSHSSRCPSQIGCCFYRSNVTLSFLLSFFLFLKLESFLSFTKEPRQSIAAYRV